MAAVMGFLAFFLAGFFAAFFLAAFGAAFFFADFLVAGFFLANDLRFAAFFFFLAAFLAGFFADFFPFFFIAIPVLLLKLTCTHCTRLNQPGYPAAGVSPGRRILHADARRAYNRAGVRGGSDLSTASRASRLA